MEATLEPAPSAASVQTKCAKNSGHYSPGMTNWKPHSLSIRGGALPAPAVAPSPTPGRRTMALSTGAGRPCCRKGIPPFRDGRTRLKLVLALSQSPTRLIRSSTSGSDLNRIAAISNSRVSPRSAIIRKGKLRNAKYPTFEVTRRAGRRRSAS
jgi:hypothetical protein